MGCIEIRTMATNVLKRGAFNRNMGCIEIGMEGFTIKAASV